MVTAMDQKLFRKAVKARVSAMSAADKECFSAVMRTTLKRCIDACDASVVAMFSPLPDEPQVWPLVDELSKRKTVVLPRVEGDVMNFYCYDKNSMAIGSYGINEPQNGLPVAPYEIDAVVVPGLAFTEGGARMGRGKGYYDKYLSQSDFSALKIGVCYREQIVPEIPLEEHDVMMDVVIYK